jgi:signal peptidase II
MCSKNNSRSRWWQLSLLVFTLLLLDQTLKIWVKLNFQLGEEMHLFGLDWARLRFVENEGMAFGWLVGGELGKTVLSFIRLVAAIGIWYTLFYFLKTGPHFYS